MSRVFDAFLYDDEAEMMAARVDALRGLLTEMVAVVANRTHQGWPVECPNPNVEYDFSCVDLSEYDKIGPSRAGESGYQVRERTHRDHMTAAVEWYDPEPDDVLLMSDVDEIPSEAFVAHVIECEHPVHVAQQRMHEFALDWLHPQCWLGTIAMRYGADGWPTTPQEARDDRGPLDARGHSYRGGGWHLSWMGGVEACMRKRSRFSHGEALSVDDRGFDWHVAHGVDVNGAQMTRVEHPEALDWPAGLLDRARVNPAYWRLP